jgi:hypothetical protein
MMMVKTREKRLDARGERLAVFRYDYGEEFFRVPVREPRELTGAARLLLSGAFCLFYGYVYWLVLAR